MDKGLRRIITKLIQQGVDPPERILDHLEKLDDPKKILRSRALLEVLLEIYEEETLNKSKGGKKMGDVYKLTCRKCEKKGLSQQQLAKLMGTSQQAISRIESGDYQGFTLKTIEKIADATGTRVKIEFVAA